MIRFAFIWLLSFVVTSQAFAATKWKNETSSDAADAVVMVENFENKNNLNVDDREGNWSVEKTADGNSVFCNKINNGWSDLNFGKENWANYSISFKMHFESDEAGSVEAHIRRRDNKGYRATVTKIGDDISIKLLSKWLFADNRGSEWLQVTLSAYDKEIGIGFDEQKQVFLENNRFNQGRPLIAVSPNIKVCIDDIIVTRIGSNLEVEIADTKFDELLNGHEYTDYQKEIATEIINGLGDRRKNLVIYDGNLFQPPESAKQQISDASLEFYYQISSARPRTVPQEYFVVEGGKDYKELPSTRKSHSKINKQLQQGTIFSFLYFSDNQIVYDALPPENRFISPFDETSQFQSHSMGKSIVSYLIGHAICKGYIASIDEKINDWPLMENTLFYNQPLLNLLNMTAGDGHVVKSKDLEYINSTNSIRNQPLISAASRETELLNTKPLSNAGYSYSNLTSDVLFNYLAHRVGHDFEFFLNDFYQEKVGIKYPVYLSLNRLIDDAEITTKNRTLQGAWTYGISATRYDYLRIAIAILNDWKNETCEGKYLKELHRRAVPTNKKDRTWKKWPGSPYPGFGAVAQRYAGQFHTSINGLHDKNVLAMMGADGQQIIINLDDERIVVIAAGQQGWYDTKSIAYDLIKSGKMKTSNWN